MKPVLTSREIKERERYTIEQIGIPSVVLMEKAALFVCSQINKDTAKKILICCSHGNNGADGMAVGRILSARGFDVKIVSVGDPARCTEENHLQRSFLEQLEISVYDGIEYINDDESCDIIIDALFGIGLNRNLEGDYLAAVRKINYLHQTHNIRVIAIDLPSGLHGDSGIVMGDAVHADITVSFQWQKTGSLLGKGPLYCGKIVIGDIGIYNTDEDFKRYLMEHQDLTRLPKRPPLGNKGTFGKILSITGSEKMAGAMSLSTKAIFRGGAGMVRVISHENNRETLLSAVPEAIFDSWASVVDGNEKINEDLLNHYFNWSTALLIGCGLSECRTAEILMEYVMKHYSKPIIADGDALNILSRHMDWLANRKENGYVTVLTPHPAEFARLCGISGEYKHQDMDYCMEWAEKYGCILAAKDAVTLITDGRIMFLNNSGSNALATAGSGDVLAGLTAALNGICSVENITDISSGTDPFNLTIQTALAVYIHGRSGVLAANKYCDLSVMAGDLPDMIPMVLKEGSMGN